MICAGAILAWRGLGSAGRVAGMIQLKLEQGVLYDLAQRGVDPVLAPGEVGHVLSGGGGLDQRLDEQGGLLAHDVRAEQGAGRGIAVQLAEARRVLKRPAVGYVAEISSVLLKARSLTVGQSTPVSEASIPNSGARRTWAATSAA